MTNRINGTHNGIVDRTGNKADSKVSGSSQGAKVRPGGSVASGTKPDKAAFSDTVVLTDRSQLLEKLEKTAAALPAVDPARVEAVKADIASGNYKIDAEKIAEILLRTDNELGD